MKLGAVRRNDPMSAGRDEKITTKQDPRIRSLLRAIVGCQLLGGQVEVERLSVLGWNDDSDQGAWQWERLGK